ncbi:hypothetical protein FPQ18DRAFT_342447 [Pyronema domesticum]|nr:hypothetical protein FPQ18DRAFT_342447 [Pyronema domesticum]
MSRRTHASFGGRKNFQASFGLGMDPDSIDEGTSILKAMEEARIVSDDDIPELEDIPSYAANKRTQAKKRQRQRAKERAAAGEVVGQPEEGKETRTETNVSGTPTEQPKNPKTEAKKRARQRKRERAAIGGMRVEGQQWPRDMKVPLMSGYLSLSNAPVPNVEDEEPPKSKESEWKRKNRERYEANGRSFVKESLAAQLAEKYDFEPTGDPEMDMMIAMGLQDMRDRGEMD